MRPPACRTSGYLPFWLALAAVLLLIAEALSSGEVGQETLLLLGGLVGPSAVLLVLMLGVVCWWRRLREPLGRLADRVQDALLDWDPEGEDDPVAQPLGTLPPLE